MGSKRKKRKNEDEDEDKKRKKRKRRRSPSSSSSSDEEERRKKKRKEKRKRKYSSSSSSEEEKRKRRKKEKKMKKKKNKKSAERVEPEAPPVRKGPMSKEDWEKRQSAVRRVFDPDTGRHRLIRGDGEILEEIVSQSRQKQINETATKGDGNSFQVALRLKMNSLK